MNHQHSYQLELYADLQDRIEHHLGGKLDETPKFHVVRYVSTGKAMICSSFQIPRSVAIPMQIESNGPEEKRPKL